MKKEIIHIALKNLLKTTGIEGEWLTEAALDNTLQVDGKLKLKIQNQDFLFSVAVKNEVRQHQVEELKFLKAIDKDFLLIAKYIFPKVKEALHQNKIGYIEANGNIFLKKNKVYLFVDTQKTIDTEKTQSNRAFTKTGLKVLFYLLQYKDDINLTQRELAKRTDVALGNIPQIIRGLQDTGFLLQLNKRKYIWENRRELLERWVTEYETTLKPTLKKEQYIYQGDWKEVKLNHTTTVWGGEPAADLLTNYLRPERLIIYTQENRHNLMKSYNLIPKAKGDIEVYEMFWKQDSEQQTAPPILIYADLLIEGGKRNKETAKIIFNDYIQPNL